MAQPRVHLRMLLRDASRSGERVAAWADYARERGGRGETIMFIDDKVPEFDKNAGGNAVYQYVRLLVEHGFKVVYLPHDRAARQPYTRTLQRCGVEVLYGSIDIERWVISHGDRIDRVVLARPTVAPAYIDLFRRHTRARVLYFTVDLHHLRELRRYHALGDRIALHESERLRTLEQRICRDVDVILTPSPDEVPIIRTLAPNRPVHAIPLYAIPMSRGPAATVVAPPLAERTDIVFLAGFQHPPNVDAARFLVEDIMPIVWREVPGAPVLIVGSNPTPEVLALAGPHVSVLGYVPDLAPYLALARMSVSPLRFGAGIKGKVISSLEAHLPVVTTSIGNEGIGLVSGVSALLGDSAEEIASHVVRLLRDPNLASALAEAGHRLVLHRFGEETTRDALLGALGFTFCPVCGLRSSVDSTPSTDAVAMSSPGCARCGADAESSILADVLVRPYRRAGAASVREALRYLSETRIRAFGLTRPIADLLEMCPLFEIGGSDKGGDREVDLIVCGDAPAADAEVGTVLDEAIGSLRGGGRLVAVARVDSEIVARLQAAGFDVLHDRPGRAGRDGPILAIDAVREA